MDIRKINPGALVPVLLCFLHVVSQFGASQAQQPLVDPAAGLPTESLDLDIAILHQESRTNAIVIAWNTTGSVEVSVSGYKVRTQRKDSDQVLHSGDLTNDTLEYEISDLVADSSYKVCVEARLSDADLCATHADNCEWCEDLKTIPHIRHDSVIALVVTLLVILLLVTIGILCWRCAIKRKSTDEEDDDEENGSDAGSESQRPILLNVPPSSNGPRRSVDFEDEDIPFITPPVEKAPTPPRYSPPREPVPTAATSSPSSPAASPTHAAPSSSGGSPSAYPEADGMGTVV